MCYGDYDDERHAVNTTDFSGFILMLGITMVAAPGVPGGAIMAALGILEGMLGSTKRHKLS